MRTNDPKTLWRKILFEYAIPLAPAIIILIYLEIVRRTEPASLLQSASFIVAAIAAIFAGVSALTARRSLEKTETALELTRNTQRPFLNISRIAIGWLRNDGQPTPVNYFVIDVCNTGVFPADKVLIDLKVYSNKNDKKKRSFVLEKERPSTYFPGEDIVNLRFKEADDKNKLMVDLGDKLRAQITIRYENKLTQQIHKTIRAYEVKYSPTAPEEPIPLPEEDYWD